MTEIRGVITAMATPFDEDGAVDEAAARRLAAHLLEHGSHGLVVAGTTGECADPDRRGEDRRCCGRSGTRSATRRSLVCGTGTNDTRHSGELTKAAAEAGADAALVVTPYYNKPNPAGLRAHFEAVAEAVAGAADVLYNIPARVVINMPPTLLGELATIENIVAVKQANDDELGPIEGLERPRRQRQRLPARRSSSAAPAASPSPRTSSAPQMREMWDAAQAGDLERAREIDAELSPSTRRLSVTTNPIPVKAALEMLGLASGPDAAAAGPGRRRAASGGQARRWRASASLAAGQLERVASAARLRVLPLGGLGEIGKNMTVVEYDGRIVVVDTGLMFPTAEMLGIDLVLPDFSYLRDRADDIEAIVLTHGHEDHVGALPYVLREIGDAAGDLRRPADDRHGPLQARRAQARATRRCRSCRRGRRSSAGPFELELVHLAALDPRHARRSCSRTEARLGADDRRLQVRPDPGRRPPGRHLAPGRDRPRRPAAALRRLDQRRPPRGRALGVERRAGAAASSSPAARAGSSSPPSPPTSTASSR